MGPLLGLLITVVRFSLKFYHTGMHGIAVLHVLARAVELWEGGVGCHMNGNATHLHITASGRWCPNTHITPHLKLLDSIF